MVVQLRFSYVDSEPAPANKATSLSTPPSNEVLSHSLKEVATLLQIQGANRFRVEAYFRAANMLLALMKPAWQIYQLDGINGLKDPSRHQCIACQGIATDDSWRTLAVAGPVERYSLHRRRVCFRTQYWFRVCQANP